MKKKKIVVHAGISSTTSGDGNNSFQRWSVQLAGIRKAIEQAARKTHSSTSIDVLRRVRAPARKGKTCHGLTGCGLQPATRAPRGGAM